MKDKVEKLLDHWLEHNNDHVASYNKWREKLGEDEYAGLENRDELRARIAEAAALIEQVSAKIREAKSLL